MICPVCGHPNNDVVDSRKSPEGIWRRRKCRNCEVTWTTQESANPTDAALRAVVDGLTDVIRETMDARQTLKKMLTRGGVA